MFVSLQGLVAETNTCVIYLSLVTESKWCRQLALSASRKPLVWYFLKVSWILNFNNLIDPLLLFHIILPIQSRSSKACADVRGQLERCWEHSFCFHRVDLYCLQLKDVGHLSDCFWSFKDSLPMKHLPCCFQILLLWFLLGMWSLGLLDLVISQMEPMLSELCIKFFVWDLGKKFPMGFLQCIGLYVQIYKPLHIESMDAILQTIASRLLFGNAFLMYMGIVHYILHQQYIRGKRNEVAANCTFR